MQRHHGGQLGIYLSQTLRCLVLFAESDRAGSKMHQTWHPCIVVHLNHTVSGELRPAVDSKDPHGRSLLHSQLASASEFESAIAIFPQVANWLLHTACAAFFPQDMPAALRALHVASPLPSESGPLPAR